MEDEFSDGRKLAATGIVSIPRNIFPDARKADKATRIIRGSEIEIDPNRIKLVGGELDSCKEIEPPTVILERNGDRIAKIIVRCPCGRSSELQCEYNDPEEDASNA